MNLAETHDLLTFIAVYDNRRFDDATVVAWQTILTDLTDTDCRTAVMGHFAESTEYLMPAHIRRGALQAERDRRRILREAHEADQKAIEAADPSRRDRSEDVRALIAQLRAQLPPGDPDSLRYASKHWRQVRESRERQERAEPNPHFDPEALKRLSEMEGPE